MQEYARKYFSRWASDVMNNCDITQSEYHDSPHSEDAALSVLRWKVRYLPLVRVGCWLSAVTEVIRPNNTQKIHTYKMFTVSIHNGNEALRFHDFTETCT